MNQPAPRPSTRNPVSGPALLFFGGGTALRGLSRLLVRQTHRSVHVITPFDNGGSSAEIRKGLGLISPGDLRNRLLALADLERPGVRGAHALLHSRIDAGASPDEQMALLQAIAGGEESRLKQLPAERSRVIRQGMAAFLERRPPAFDAAGASLGNLVLTGLMLESGETGQAIDRFAGILSARGLVRPASTVPLDLVAGLDDGSRIVGQEAITRRQASPSAPRIESLSFVAPGTANARPVPPAEPEVLRTIPSAELLCYACGSFWTSLVASLLPVGITKALRDSARPKVWIPSTFPDPEVAGLRLEEQADLLLAVLGVAPGSEDVRHLMTHVLVDPRRGRYPGGLSSRALSARGLRVVEAELVTSVSSPALDPERTAACLRDLC